MSASHAEALSDLRCRLLANGYEPVPIIGPDEQVKSAGKRPRLPEWQSIEITPPRIRAWARDFAADTNTGIRCGQILGVDIDVLNAELARGIEDLAVAMLGATPLRRIGRAPKLLLAYRSVEAQAKAETPEFILPDGSKAQVEVLAKGQQFVSHGVHPDTHQAYVWTAQAPDTVPVSALPVAQPGRVRAFLAAAASLLQDAGGQVAQAPERQRKQAEPQRGTPRQAGAEGGFFRSVNDRALASADLWVKALFPRAYWQPNAATPPGAWRVASKDLGRGLEEDIAIHVSQGCQDFGTRESLTPIDLVMRHAGAPDAPAAALWLCERLSLDPAALGWNGRKPGEPRLTRRIIEEFDRPEPPPWDAAPPDWEPDPTPDVDERAERRAGSRDDGLRDAPKKDALWTDDDDWEEADIAERPWIARGYIMRKAVTILSGPGGGGKSNLSVGWSTALATGRRLGRFEGIGHGECYRQLVYNVEDDRDEQRRRYSAALRQHDLTPRALKGMVVRCGPMDVGTLIRHDPASGKFIFTDAWDALDAKIAEVSPDVVWLDPLVELHTAEENDNTALRQVVAYLRALAIKHDCGIVLIHHARKGATAGDADGIRGAGAIVGASRISLTVIPMTAEEAEEMQVPPDQRDLFFRVDGAKANYSRRGLANWHTMQEYELANGDLVAGVIAWQPGERGSGAGLDPERLAIIEAAVRRGTPDGPYSPRLSQSEPRSILGLLIRNGFETRGYQGAVLAALTKAGFQTKNYRDTNARSVKQGLRSADGQPLANWCNTNPESETP